MVSVISLVLIRKENQGKGKFQDVTDQLGKCRHSFGMSHAVADFDGDGSLDIYMVGMGSTTAVDWPVWGWGKGFEHLEAARIWDMIGCC